MDDWKMHLVKRCGLILCKQFQQIQAYSETQINRTARKISGGGSDGGGLDGGAVGVQLVEVGFGMWLRQGWLGEWGVVVIKQ